MSTTSTIDKMNSLKGVFTMRVKDLAGNVVMEYEDHNMIVNAAKTAMAALISDPAAHEKKVITSFGVGTGMNAASATDTALTNPYIKGIVGYDYPEGTFDRVRFHWTLEYSEANHKPITEFGLFCADGTLFAHKVRDVISKDDTLAFEGTWTIIF